MDHDFDNRPELEEGRTTPHLTLEQLTAYLDGDLTTGERVRLDDHLRTCRDCRRELTELRSTLVLLNGLPEYRPRRSFQLTPERVAATRPWWERLGFRLLPALPALRAATVAAAILLVAVSAGEIVRDRTGHSSAPPEAAFVQPTTVTNQQGDAQGGAAGPTATAGATAPTVTPRPAGAGGATRERTQTVQAAAIRPAPVTKTVEQQGAGGSGAGAAQPTSESSGSEVTAEEPSGEDTSGQQDTSGTTAQSDAAAAAPPAAAAPAATETPAAGAGDTAQIAMASVPEEATTTAKPTSGGEAGRSAAPNKAADEEAAVTASPPATPSPAPSATASPTAATPTAIPAPPATPVVAAHPAADSGDGLSGWRLAQIGLAFLLIWLVVTVVGLQRLRGRR